MLPEYLNNKILKIVKKYKLSDKHKNEIIKNVEIAYDNAKIAPGEAIGIITAESFGEPSTQMSLDFLEKIIIKVNDKIKIVKIGKFIDELFKINSSVKLNEHSEIISMHDNEIYVPSINSHEKIEWKKIAECSRHKINKKLLKLITVSGRKITATDNHSFVTRVSNNIVPIIGRELSAGMRIPSIKYLPEHCIEAINVTDYIEFPDFNKGNAIRDYRPTKFIPSQLDLNWDFGWFIGAYLAEGNATNGTVSISNLDDNYINNAKRFVSSIGLDFTEDIHNRGFALSRDLKINSSLLVGFIINSCSTGSENKFVPEFAFSAKEEFVSGLLRGYFDGDGNFSADREMIRVSSNSKELLDGISLLLNRFDIFAFKCKDHKQDYLIIPYKYAPIFLEKIGSDIEYKLNNLNKIAEIASKNFGSMRDNTDAISGFDNILIDVSKKLELPCRFVNSFTKRQRIGRSVLIRHINRFSEVAKIKGIDISQELEILNDMAYSDIVWDEIEKIEYIDSSSEYVYDLSVLGLETFTTFDGIVTHNTLNVFHFAGVAEMQVTVGLPRLIEIFDARKKPSTPEMKIPIKAKYSRTIEAVREVALNVRETRLKDIIDEITINVAKSSVEIMFDRKIMRDFGIKPKEVLAKVAEAMKDVEIKEGEDSLTLKPKDKEIVLSEVYKLKEKAKNIHVKGLEGITHVLPIKNDEGAYIIHCAGSNLKDALKLEEAEQEKIVTNDIFEIMNTLGIEAARSAIIEETHKVIREQGIEIDMRHIMFLADLITRTGVIKGVTRTGITGEKGSVLARASFETPIKHIINASLVGERDDLNSVVENVILNQPVPIGTGLPGLTAKMKEEKNELSK